MSANTVKIKRTLFLRQVSENQVKRRKNIVSGNFRQKIMERGHTEEEVENAQSVKTEQTITPAQAKVKRCKPCENENKSEYRKLALQV